MARVLGIHEVELDPGTDPDEFERLAADAVASAAPEGWRALVLKGERGRRPGKYLLAFEIDSLEARNRMYPEFGLASQESEQFDQQHPEAAALWERMFSMIANMNVAATDYVVIAE